jgi:hypothetical protein
MSFNVRNRAALGAGIVIAVFIGTQPGFAQTSVAAASRAVARVRGDGIRLVRATRAASTVVIDGRLDDSAWRSTQPVSDFVQQRPAPGAAASERTEARVVFDAAALYVALRLFDSHADSLIAPLGRRDAESYGDWAHVIIDSYHDRKTGFHFAVNPAGTRRDGMISNDAEWQEDKSWDAVWEVATSRDSLGWSAEFRIPLTQLRFDRCGGAAPGPAVLARPGDANEATGTAVTPLADCVWGVQFVRDIGRRNERSLWAPIALDAGGYVSRFGTLAGIDGLRAPRRFELVPYSVAQVTRAPLDPGNPFYQRTALNGALGADLGLGITSTLTVTATINPDFGQVEADPSEVNLTGFETFLRERRPFFVEGSDIFQYPLGDGFFFGEEQLFYSRRIGRPPQLDDPDDAGAVDRPDATTIVGAAKLSGKVGSWTLGLLDAVTGAEHARYTTPDARQASVGVEPATNYAVARLSRDDAAGRKTIGVAATAVHRDLDARAAQSLRSSAVTAGIDGRIRSPGRNYTFSANVLGSYVRGSPAAIAETQRSSVHLLQRPDRGGDRFDSTRTSLTGMSAELRASKQGGGHWRWGANGRVVTSGFEVNDLGFQQRSDVASVAGWVGYSHTEPGRIVRRWDLWSNHWARWSLTGERERLTANVFANAQFQSNWMAMGELRREFSQISPTLLRGGPATFVPSNVFWFGRIVSDPRRMVSGELATQGFVDDVGGGRRLTVFPTVTVRPSSRAEISLQPSLGRVRNPAQYVETASAGGDTSVVMGALSQTTASLTARLNLTFTPVLSLQLYAQPFVSAGEYKTLGEVRDARAQALDRRVASFGTIGQGDDGQLRIDRGPGRALLTIDDPDFAVRELKSNAVLRWEYRPGSALFLVWAQARNDDARASDVSLARRARELWRTTGTNVLLIKASYWISR